MDAVTETFNRGGPFMFGVALVLLLSLGAAIALAIVAAFRLRVPAAIWLMPPALCALIGLLGTYLGQVQVSKALGAASVEYKDALLFSGLSIGQYTAVSGWLGAATGLLAVACCVGLGQVIGAGKGARWRFARAPIAALVALLGAAAAAALHMTQGSSSPMPWLVVGLFGLGVVPAVLVSLREGVEARDQERGIAARITVGASLLLAVVASVAAIRTQALIQTYRAPGGDTLDELDRWLAAALALADETGAMALVGLLFAVVLLAVLALAPLARMATLRSILSATAVLLLLVPVAAAWLAVDRQASRVAEGSYLWRAADEAGRLASLPVARGAVRDQAPVRYSHLMVREGDGWQQVEGDGSRVAATPLSTEDVPLLLAFDDLSARALLDEAWFTSTLTGEAPLLRVLFERNASAVPTTLPIAGAARFGAQNMLWLPAVEGSAADESGWAEEDPEWIPSLYKGLDARSVLFVVEGSPGRLADMGSANAGWLMSLGLAPEPLATGEALENQLRNRVGNEGHTHVVLIPDTSWTLEQVVNLCRWATDGRDVDPRYGYPDVTPVRCAMDGELPTAPRLRAALLGEPPPERERSGRDRRSGGTGQEGRDRGVKGNVGGAMAITYGDVGDLNAAKKYVRRKKGQINACYEQELKADQSLTGKIEVVWTVNPDGFTSGVTISANTTGNRSLEDCIVRRIKRWKFPEQADEYEITYPFNFFPA